MDESSTLASSPLSRRAVLQLGGGAASLAAIPSGDALSADAVGTEALPVGSIRLIVNGESKELELDARQSLLDLLRETLDLPGTKKGCNQGACGACTILVERQAHRLLPDACVDARRCRDPDYRRAGKGRRASPSSAGLRRSTRACNAVSARPARSCQALGCIAEGHAGSPEEIQFWMSGNICRCGAYPGIVAAVADAARRT